MARIAGIDLPKNKRGEIGLTYIYGIGVSTAQYILGKAGIDVNKKVNQWDDDELNAIRDRKSTRLNSSHITISYAVFCLNKKKHTNHDNIRQHYHNKEYTNTTEYTVHNDDTTCRA